MTNYTDLVQIPEGINQGLTAARQLTMKSIFGMPTGRPGKNCGPVTQPALKRMMTTANIGPEVELRVTGMKPFVAALRAALKAAYDSGLTDLVNGLKSSGGLCVRRVRGARSAVSNHSWGTAWDVRVDGVLDPYGDGTVQYGLTLLAPFMNAQGLYWGAAFRKEDGMHFEASDQLIRQWHADEALLDSSEIHEPKLVGMLSKGDRGPEVKVLQTALGIHADGIFGPATDRAVRAFQRSNGLVADGIVGPTTRARLS